MKQLAPEEVYRAAERLQSEQAAESQDIFRNSDCGDCFACRGVGWLKIETEEFVGMRRCECVTLRAKEKRLAGIPLKFRDATFESYEPRSPDQMRTRCAMMDQPQGSYLLHGRYGAGKTHLLYSQYRVLVLRGHLCHVRTTEELLQEIQREEFERDFVSPVLDAVRTQRRYHLFWDDCSEYKPTDFKFQGLYYLVDTIYKRQLRLTATSSLTLLRLGEEEKLPQSVIRRLDDMCQVLEV